MVVDIGSKRAESQREGEPATGNEICSRGWGGVFVGAAEEAVAGVENGGNGLVSVRKRGKEWCMCGLIGLSGGRRG